MQKEISNLDSKIKSPLSQSHVDPYQSRESSFTKSIEAQTSKIPSSYFLAAATGALAVSVGLAVLQRQKGLANFVGQWVPTFLLLGIYNKIVKTHGSDATENPEQLRGHVH